MTPSIVALIPARAGSKRIPGKNTRDFFGQPLIAHTIQAAKDSGIFSEIIVCSDDQHALDIAETLKVSTMDRLPSQDDEPDIAWVWLIAHRERDDAFAILRPTSPFRRAETIQRAWNHFLAYQPMDSLRAVEPVRQHPLKMWRVDRPGREMQPLLDEWPFGFGMAPLRASTTPFHSMPTQILPTCYAQNASLEIAWTKTVNNRGSISGDRVLPFLTEGYEGFDLNTEDDWREATRLVRDGLVALPTLATQTSTALTE